jgi:hypothetical protein
MAHAALVSDDTRKKPGPVPKHQDEKNVRLRLPGELLKKVKALAYLDDLSENDAMIEALEQWCDQHPKRPILDAKAAAPPKRRQ